MEGCHIYILNPSQATITPRCWKLEVQRWNARRSCEWGWLTCWSRDMRRWCRQLSVGKSRFLITHLWQRPELKPTSSLEYQLVRYCGIGLLKSSWLWSGRSSWIARQGVQRRDCTSRQSHNFGHCLCILLEPDFLTMSENDKHTIILINVLENVTGSIIW